VLQPLLAAGVFAFVFGRVANLTSSGLPYLVFAMAGLLGWNLFSGTLTRATGSLLSAGPMVSKIYFARMVLPLSVLGAVLVDFCVGLCVLATLLIGYGIGPNWHLTLLPVWLLVMLAMGTGLGLVTSSVSVRYRDVGSVVPMLTQLVLFVSPVAYNVANVPGSLKWAVDINPLTGALQGFRWSLLGRGSIDPGAVILSVAVAVTLLVAGCVVFASLERDFADVI
jgi:lipopolysaccharide transport system permease protein